MDRPITSLCLVHVAATAARSQYYCINRIYEYIDLVIECNFMGGILIYIHCINDNYKKKIELLPIGDRNSYIFLIFPNPLYPDTQLALIKKSVCYLN